MSKLIVCYIIENDEDVFELSYNSIKDVADEVVIIDGNWYDSCDTRKYTEQGDNIIIKSAYPHEDKGANGIQRNKYLDYVKEHFEGDWCLVLDADEVVDKSEQIKEAIKQLEENKIECANVHMRHCIGNLGQEDATVQMHFVPTRLFKITKDISYNEAEHVTLNGIKGLANVGHFCIWHLGYSREIFKLKKKYENHLEKSNIHSKEYLEEWYHNHLLGEYPVSKVNPDELPKIIKDHFKINSDYLYFRNRTVELKHAEMVKRWNEYFHPESVLEFGCGRGPYLRYWEMCCNNECLGVELSAWAIENKICDSPITHSNILHPGPYPKHDLVTAIDLLEHLEYVDLDEALEHIYESGNKDFLFSIPFVGNPDLEADKTHIIKEDKQWWLDKLKEHDFKIKETPQDFLFKEQIIIAE